MLALLQDIKDPKNLKTLKTIIGNRSMNEFLSVLKDVHEAHQQLVAEHHTLKTKHLSLKKDLTNLQKQPQPTPITTDKSEPSPRDTTPGTSTQGEQGKKKKAKMPDPPIFQNDGNPT